MYVHIEYVTYVTWSK